MRVDDLSRVVSLVLIIFLMFMVTWNMIHLISEYLDTRYDKEIDINKKGKRILALINSKEFFARPTITRNPYKESKLYKKAYILAIINIIVFSINIVCLIIFLLSFKFNQAEIVRKIVVYIIFFIIGLNIIFYTIIYQIEKYKWIKREKKME